MKASGSDSRLDTPASEAGPSSETGLSAESVVRALADASPEAVLVTDASGRIAYANEAAERVFGRPERVMAGQPSWILFPPDHREEVKNAFKKGLGAPGRPWTTEVSVGGHDRPLALTVTNYEPPPAAHTVLVRLREANPQTAATQRESELEAQLRRAQKMMAVGQTTAGIAHDFNNILTVISAATDLIEDGIDPSDEHLLEELQLLREATESGTNLVRKLMGFSRSAPVHPVPTDVGSLMRKVRPMLDRLLPTGVELDLLLTSSDIAHCDPNAVEQIVMNLVTNARDAVQDGGRIRVTVTDRVVEEGTSSRPEWLRPGAFVRITVRDDGVGMDEATLARVLEPFFTTKPQGAGTGLGLAMVYGLTKQQGGYLELQSEVGQGTTAHVYLPKPPAPGGRDSSRTSGDRDVDRRETSRTA